MRSQAKRAAGLGFLHVTLGLWLGIHAFRAFVPAAAWNLSDALPLYLKGALAIGIHLAGIAGYMLPFTKRPDAMKLLAVALAVTGVLRQILIGDDVLGSMLSLLGWILWLWWLAAFARVATHERAQDVAVAFATAFVLQVGMQAAWHGLDLPMARGAVAIACAFMINGLFAWTAQVRSVESATNAERGQATRVFGVLGAAFFLELTLLSNLGRVGEITRLDMVPAAFVIQAGLLIGMLVNTLPKPKVMTYAAILVLVVGTGALLRFGIVTSVLLITVQVALIVVLSASSAHRTASFIRPFLAGTITLFVFVFLFYNQYEWPALWLVAAFVLAISTLPARSSAPAPRSFIAYALVGLVFTGSGALGVAPRAGRAVDNADVRILTYNIHQGFDAVGVPAMQRIVDEIVRMNADIIALQEVGRGWTLLGGADLVSYLKYRLSDYQTHFVPVNGQLWGVALLSRAPLRARSGHVFEAPRHVFRYGVAAGSVHLGATELRVASVHLSAGLEGDGADARLEQVDQLLRSVSGYDNVVIAGDLNTHPDEPPLQRILAGDYIDAGVATGLGRLFTWPAHAPNERIDYVLLRGGLRATGGEVKRSTASDHLPVLMRVVTEHRDRTP